MRIRSLTGLVSGLVAALLLGSASHAQELEELPEPNWIPSIDVGFEVFEWESEGTVQNLVNGPLWSGTGTDSIRHLLFEVGGELLGPPATALPGRPRLFFGGGVGIRTQTTNKTFDVGDPVAGADPEDDISRYLGRLDVAVRRRCREIPARECPPPDVTDSGALDFGGQGSDIRAILDDPTWFANLGVSFDIPLLETSLLQVRPSLAYRGERVDLAGRLTTVTLDQFDLMIPPGGCTTQSPCTEDPVVEFGIHRSRTPRKSVTYHHLGPRLELGIVLSRNARPIRTTLYVEGSFLWLLGDRTEQLADDTGVATYTVRREATALRGGAGIRFGWVGGLGAD